MARRRKRTKNPRQAQGGANAGAAEKALPSLPPTAYTPETETPPSDRHTDTPPLGRRSSQDRLRPQNKASPANLQRDASPLSDDLDRSGFPGTKWLGPSAMADSLTVNGPTLPSSTYGASRPSNVSDSGDENEERGFLPMVLDNTPIASPASNALARKQLPSTSRESSPQVAQAQNENKLPRDYFGRLSAKPPLRDAAREDIRAEPYTSAGAEREPSRAPPAKSSPHILYQDKSRQTSKRDTSESNTPVTGSSAASPAIPSYQEPKPDRSTPLRVNNASGASASPSQDDAFRLQEVPPSKKAASRTSSTKDAKSPMLGATESSAQERNETEAAASPSSVASNDDVNPFNDPKRRDGTASSATHPHAPIPKQADRPARGDSLNAAAHRSTASTAEPLTPSTMLSSDHERTDSTATSTYPIYFSDAQSTLSSVRTSIEQPPPRSVSRPGASAPSRSVTNGDFVAPRQPPLPPGPPERPHHRTHESISTMQSYDDRLDTLSPAIRSAGLPKHSAAGSFSMEEEMARILNGDKQPSTHARDDGGSTSVLRRVSNAVKHGRSFSDRGLASPNRKSQSVSPHASQIEISSPMHLPNSTATSPPSQNVLDQLRAQLKRAHQRIADLESEKTGLEEKVNNSDEIEAASNELREKRNTMVVLDTQREMVVAELESMTLHLQKAKDSNRPLDLNALKSDVSREFAESLQKIKDQMSHQIEDLMHKRSELTNEIGQLIQMKDKGFQEYESVSAKNAQLQQMNNELVHSIQETYKSNRGAAGGASAQGLGIYSSDMSVGTPTSISEGRHPSIANTDASISHILHGDNAEPATVLTAPQMVNIRKGQPKKFNWRKGGEKMAKNVTKGLKGAFVGDGKSERDLKSPYGEIGLPYNQMHQQAPPGSDPSTLNGNKMGADKNAAYALFAQKNGASKIGGPGAMKDGSNTNLVTAADASVLFGSELEARCEFEKRMIPSIVSRCIEEVELRGMDVEGVYRKSGGSGQVKTVQQGFEKDGLYDISDPDLDIHAVTSAMKQYFRKLPTPLITYDAYDALLEAGALADREKQAVALRAAVADLPEHHRNCLEYLVQHLARIMSREAQNLMTPLNLAVVFAPTIMRPLSIEREMSDMLAQRTAVQALLERHQVVFAGDED
nr:isoform 3 of n-chimaerin [Quercus suber]